MVVRYLHWDERRCRVLDVPLGKLVTHPQLDVPVNKICNLAHDFFLSLRAIVNRPVTHFLDLPDHPLSSVLY
jgi:hypothetical protein